AGALLAEAPACDQLLAAGILLMFVDLGPVFPGDGAALLESWTGRGASGEPHGGSRSSDRLSSATRPTARPPDGAAAVETRLTFAAIGAALWALLAVRFGASLLSASIEGIRESTGTGHARLDLFLGALVLVVLAGGLGCGLARLSGVPIRWASGPAFLGNRAARLMLPIALLAVPALTLGPPGLTALAHVCVLGLLLVELPRLASETRGSRLAVGLWSLLAGIVLQALATVPLALAQLGLFDSAALPNLLVRLPGDASWLGLAGLGAALTAEVWRRELAAGKALTGGVALCTGIAGAYLAGTVWGALEAVALGLAPAAALALLLGHEATPLRHFWRTFILAASCLAASVWAAILPQAGFWVIARLHVAGLLFLAAALRAGHIALCIPVPRQAARPASHGSSDICGALQSGAGQVFTGLLRMTGDFLGADLAVVIARDFDARPGGAKDFPLRFDAGRAVIPLPSSTGLREAVLPLRMALCFLQDRIVDSGGVLFFDQALSVAAADLGLMEWEVVQALLLPGGPVSLPWRGTLEELRRFPLFSDLTEEHLSSLEKALRRERHPDGACVVRQGERGDRLLSGGVRNASVVADGPVELASLGAAEFDAALVDRKNVTPLIRHGPLLQRVPLFTGLPAFVLGRLAAALEAERFADGAEAVSEGAPLQRLLIVREGRLEGPGVLIGPGDVHGQQALGGAEPASPRLRARGPSSVLWLECAAVRESIADWLASLDGLDELDRRLAAGTAPQPD
ncbi:MAG: hypothetical protein HY303_01720, partial [Candidatus Wallbacteria bacterium]|nr:hypothetical protein [Candidatus Wallbacteria bacterium]